MRRRHFLLPSSSWMQQQTPGLKSHRLHICLTARSPPISHAPSALHCNALLIHVLARPKLLLLWGDLGDVSRRGGISFTKRRIFPGEDISPFHFSFAHVFPKIKAFPKSTHSLMAWEGSVTSGCKCPSFQEEEEGSGLQGHRLRHHSLQAPRTFRRGRFTSAQPVYTSRCNY